MKISKYKREFDYSYCLGAFPSLEVINHKTDDIICVYIHSTFKNVEVLQGISNKISKDKIIYDDKVFEKISDKDNVYVIAVFRKYSSNINNSMDHVILDNISNMGNLGTIIRSSLGFGISNIALIGNNIDYFDPKVIRSSMGSIFSVNIQHFDSLDDYLENNSNHHIYPFMLKSKNHLANLQFDKDLVSLVFGNESSGLDENIYSKYDSVVIDHNKTIDSLNITNAISIALYEYYNQKK